MTGGGRSLQITLREPSYLKNPIRRDLRREKSPTQETPQESDILTDIYFLCDHIHTHTDTHTPSSEPLRETHSHRDTVSTGKRSSIRNSPVTLKIIAKTDGLGEMTPPLKRPSPPVRDISAEKNLHR